jgi:pantetheine-phosphate adenylyltransferase
MERAVYPGSFDPITYGHLDIIRRGARLFEELIIAIATNFHKQPLFPVEERIEMARAVTRGIPNVRVDSFSGITVKYTRQQGCRIILRGMRTMSDFENELQLAQGNRAMDDSIETILLLSSREYSHFSSHRIKEIVALGGDASFFLPDEVFERMKKKLLRRESTNTP